jgi:hypothetical protein
LRPAIHLRPVRPSPRPERIPPQPVTSIGLVEGRNDLAGSIAALRQKYSLDGFTLASGDGLVVASTEPEGGREEAARYAEMYVNTPLFETPGFILFGLPHKGSDLVGIIRTNRELSDEICQNIADDTKDILNSWI